MSEFRIVVNEGSKIMDLSNRIIQLREEAGISTNKLANKAGISQSYLREIEIGKKNPTVEILSYICDALNISLETFFSENAKEINPVLLDSIKMLTYEQQKKLAEFICELK